MAILLTDGRVTCPYYNELKYYECGRYIEDDDAVNEANKQHALSAASAAASAGYKIFTIGLGSDINTAMLTEIASITGAKKGDGSPGYYYAPSSGDLTTIYTEISQQLCEYGSVSGCKYEDTDNDGNVDDETITIPDWEIILSGHSNAAQLTDENGCYQFSGLLPGTYEINEGGKAGVDVFNQTYPVSGSYQNIILPEGQNLENYDFGNYLFNSYCGNGVVEDGEECDGQEGIGDHQSCSNECTLNDLTYCGDGIEQMPNDEETGGPQDDGYEQCDDGPDGSANCTVECVFIETPQSYCGDGIINEDNDEECDDGDYNGVECNPVYGDSCDYCSSSCQTIKLIGPYCGDGIENGDEDCDDGNSIDDDECSNECIINIVESYCGDGVLDEENNEECDEGENNGDNAYCSNQCIINAICNNGLDDDEDGITDADAPACHSDGDVNNEESYDPEDDDEYNEPSPYCGDGTCNNNETCSTCPQDCGSCGGGGGGGGGWTPPTVIKITDEKADCLESGEALITWKTNITTTNQVAYDDNSVDTENLGDAPGYGYNSVNEESGSMYEEHSVTITGLTDGAMHYFRPVADRNGSEEVVGDEVFCVFEEGEVKGTEAPIPPPEECNYLLEYIKLGADNNPVEVEKVERFLNEFEGENLLVNGIYEQVDFDAVSRFQEKYLNDVLSPWSHNKATGYVYITTKKKINELYCQREFPLTAEQEAEVALFSERMSDILSESVEMSDDDGEDSETGNGEDEYGRVGGVEDEEDKAEDENKDETVEDKDVTETKTTETEDKSEITIQDIQEKNGDDSEYAGDRYSKYLPAFLIIVIIIAGGAWYFFYRRKGKGETK